MKLILIDGGPPLLGMHYFWAEISGVSISLVSLHG